MSGSVLIKLGTLPIGGAGIDQGLLNWKGRAQTPTSTVYCKVWRIDQSNCDAVQA